MSNLICCTSQAPVGCTFLEWSINYLAGRKQYLHKIEGWIDLVDNPVGSVNAHRHHKNMPCGFEDVKSAVTFLQQHTEFATLYPSAPHIDVIAKQKNIDVDCITHQQLQDVQADIVAEYNKTLQWLANNHAQIVYVSLSKSLPLYLSSKRNVDRLFYTGEPGTQKEELSFFDKTFFQHDVQHWNNSGPTNVWDLRERLALNVRPFQYQPWPVDLSIPHIWVDSQELWYNGKNKIPEILQSLQIKLDTQRLPQWLNVFEQWQKIQLDSLKFQYQCQHIIDSIVHGWSYNIDLNFYQEVIIQHCLIYQHNLNLKTWQLEKFPNNTKDLHALLEPNIHPL